MQLSLGLLSALLSLIKKIIVMRLSLVRGQSRDKGAGCSFEGCFRFGLAARAVPNFESRNDRVSQDHSRWILLLLRAENAIFNKVKWNIEELEEESQEEDDVPVKSKFYKEVNIRPDRGEGNYHSPEHVDIDKNSVPHLLDRDHSYCHSFHYIRCHWEP